MATVGTTVKVGENAPETGRYLHSGCKANTIILNKGNNVPPCGLGSCPNKGAYWTLTQILT
jgi:hypothetical protein